MFIQKLALISLLGSVTVLSHMTVVMSAYAEARSLKEVMSDMGKKLGGIARTVQQGTAGATEARLSRELHALVLEGASIMPDSVTRLPQDERGPRAELYAQLMQKLADAVLELEAGIAAGDMPRAQAALQLMLRLRGQGHEQFKI